jgi:hypothetical protein
LRSFGELIEGIWYSDLLGLSRPIYVNDYH